MKEEEIVYSLKNKQDILNSDEYLNDKKISEEKIDAIIEILKNYYVGVLFTK